MTEDPLEAPPSKCERCEGRGAMLAHRSASERRFDPDRDLQSGELAQRAGMLTGPWIVITPRVCSCITDRLQQYEARLQKLEALLAQPTFTLEGTMFDPRTASLCAPDCKCTICQREPS